MIFECYYFIMSVIGFALMGIDKKKAVRHAWRIPEKTLFLIALLGGCLGVWAGMYVFRHKTRHLSFVIGVPVILLIHAGIIWFHYNCGVMPS